MKPAAGGEIHWELSLDLEGMGSLGGLEYLTQLQLSADFAAGAEPDLAPLSGLTALTTLRLHLPYGISVSLRPLGALTQLRDLNFAGEAGRRTAAIYFHFPYAYGILPIEAHKISISEVYFL